MSDFGRTCAHSFMYVTGSSSRTFAIAMAPCRRKSPDNASTKALSSPLSFAGLSVGRLRARAVLDPVFRVGIPACDLKG